MKKSLKIFLACLLLSSCSIEDDFSGQTFSSEEVLSRAAQASNEIESFAFDASFSFRAVTEQENINDGTIILKGNVDSNGEQMSTSINANITFNIGDVSDNYSVDAQMRVLGPRELYLQLNSFESENNKGFIVSEELLQAISGKWWVLNSLPESAQTATVAPDPKLLNAQAKVVRVVSEFPLEKIDDAFAYHYEVAIDSVKLVEYLEEVALAKEQQFNKELELEKYKDLNAKGELWIDAKTFVTRKVKWNLESFRGIGKGTLEGDLQAVFYNWNNVEPISAPPDAKVFDTAIILQLMTENMDFSINDEFNSYLEEDTITP